MDPLDLHVEQGMRVDLHAGTRGDHGGETLLVGQLDLAEPAAEFRLIGRVAKALEFLQVVFPAVPETLRQQLAQAGVGLLEPPAHGNAIGDVGEPFRQHRGELGEDRLLHELRMQSRHAVHAPAADDRQVRHPDFPAAILVDDGHPPAEVVVSGIAVADPIQELPVDQVDDLQVSRQVFLEHRHGPGLERLGQQRVVGVAEDVIRQLPRPGPLDPVFVDQQPQEFGNRQCRVRVVELDRDCVGKLVDAASLGQVGRQQVLQARTHEEVLLTESQLAPLRRRVVGVEDPRKVFRRDLVFHRRGIVAGVERLDVERRHGAPRPEPEVVDRRAAVAGNEMVESDRQQVAGADPAVPGAAIAAPLRLAAPAKLHGVGCAAAGDLPGIPVPEPAAGNFLLLPVRPYHLREDPVVVANAIADRRVLQRRQRIEVTRRQPPQAAVAQPRIHF